MLDSARKKIIFPLDVGDIKTAKAWVRRLNGLVGHFKVGLELFTAEGPSVLKMIGDESEAGIFLDLKFYDIPVTMAGALLSSLKYYPRFLSIHAHQGEKLKEAVEIIQEGRTTVLAVTLLTSVAQSELAGMGMREDLTLQALVDLRVEQALRAGCGGIVCSGQEVGRIRKRPLGNLKIVVPGIRPAFAVNKKDDQQRIATPSQAIRGGADYLVIGRPIRLAKDPVRAVEKIVAEIAESG